MLVLQTGWLMLTGNVSTLFWIPCMIIAIGMMFLFLWMVIEATWKMVAYCCMKAFLTAEFMASLEWQLEYFAYRGRTEKGVLSILTAGDCVWSSYNDTLDHRIPDETG